MQATLHLLMGLPGSGKTTLSNCLQEITGASRVSSDDYRLLLFREPTFSQDEHDTLYEIIDHNVEHLLQSGHSVIYDANLNRLIHRNDKYKIARKYNAKTILWWVQTPKVLAKSRRLRELNHILIPSGDDPSRMFDRVSKILEIPINESHIVIDGTKITAEYVASLLANYAEDTSQS